MTDMQKNNPDCFGSPGCFLNRELLPPVALRQVGKLHHFSAGGVGEGQTVTPQGDLSIAAAVFPVAQKRVTDAGKMRSDLMSSSG